MNKKFAVLGQLPPPGVANSEIFLANLKANPTKHPLLLYSSAWKDEPGIIPIKGDPGQFYQSEQTPFLRSNLSFFTALLIARAHELDYMLYIEADCRVRGAGWDHKIWSEFSQDVAADFFLKPTPVMGGTPVCFNPMGWSFTTAKLALDYMAIYNTDSVCPMAMTGHGQLAEVHKPCLFVNGALGIYDVKWMLKTFGDELGNTMELATKCPAWDYELGLRLWDQVDDDAFELVKPLHTVYSGYGEILSCEAQRMEWLRRGPVVAVHQIKAPWLPSKQPHAMNRPSMEILIVTYAQDFLFLDYTLKSIKKFATGFKQTTVVVPEKDKEQCEAMFGQYEIKIVGIKEDPRTGFNNHQAAICTADQFCESSLILHMDADCLFKEPVTPKDYLKGNLPIMQFQEYAKVKDELHKQWGPVAEAALKFKVDRDFMSRHPSVHWRFIYPLVRSHIERLHHVPNFRDWVLSKQNDFPQGFAEFPTLGAFAWRKFHDHYHWHDMDDQVYRMENKMIQGWCRGGLDHPITWRDTHQTMSCRERFDAILSSVKNE